MERSATIDLPNIWLKGYQHNCRVSVICRRKRFGKHRSITAPEAFGAPDILHRLDNITSLTAPSIDTSCPERYRAQNARSPTSSISATSSAVSSPLVRYLHWRLGSRCNDTMAAPRGLMTTPEAVSLPENTQQLNHVPAHNRRRVVQVLSYLLKIT